jgi:hypothetical protein
MTADPRTTSDRPQRENGTSGASREPAEPRTESTSSAAPVTREAHAVVPNRGVFPTAARIGLR